MLNPEFQDSSSYFVAEHAGLNHVTVPEDMFCHYMAHLFLCLPRTGYTSKKMEKYKRDMERCNYFELQHDKTNKMTCMPSNDSEQSDQSSLVLNGKLRTQGLFVQTAKTLIGLHRCPGWSEPSLGTQVILLILSCSGGFVDFVRSNVSVVKDAINSFIAPGAFATELPSLMPESQSRAWGCHSSQVWQNSHKFKGNVLTWPQ